VCPDISFPCGWYVRICFGRQKSFFLNVPSISCMSLLSPWIAGTCNSCVRFCLLLPSRHSTKLFLFCGSHSKSTTLTCRVADPRTWQLERGMQRGMEVCCFFVELFRGAIPTYITTGGTALVRFLPGARDFSALHKVLTGCGARTASYPMGTGTAILGGKAQGREADHSPPSSAEVKNCGAIPPLPHVSSWHSA
jgi:hypothetical protein